MTGEASAYAALGLEPGADAATVEQAYKRLIKEHQPDRSGGDALRAAEINRAYRELRAGRELREPLELIDEDMPDVRRGSGWVAAALLASLVASGLMLTDSRLLPIRQGFASGKSQLALPHARRGDAMEEPLNLAAIDGSARSALQIARTRDEMSLATASNDCHRELRRRPTLLQLDRCAAFDDAVVELQDRDPLRDQGPFGELAVTGRIWSGASALSDDSLAIDNRLDRIRLRVEIALAPFVDPAKQPGPSAAN